MASSSNGSPVYKLHQLYRDVLIQRLSRDDPKRLHDLYEREGASMEKRNRTLEAIQLYVEAGQQKALLAVLDREYDSFFDLGYYYELGRWIDALPMKSLENHPDLLLCRARIAIQLGDIESGLKHSSMAFRAFQASSNLHDQVTSLLTSSTALRRYGMGYEALEKSKQEING